MLTRRPFAFTYRQWVVGLLAALALWAGAAPVLMRVQAAQARTDMASMMDVMGMMGMEVCSFSVNASRSSSSSNDRSDPSMPEATAEMPCPWCLLVMNLALPVPQVVAWAALAQLTTTRPSAESDTPSKRSAWTIVPPSRGPPLAQTP